jgi:AcrR family transcriptional regulator
MTARRYQTGTRSAILDAALELFSLSGLAGVTLGNLARRVGMSKSGLFNHFKSIEEVHLAVIEQARLIFYESIKTKADQAPIGLARLKATAITWLYAISQPGPFGGAPLLAAILELDDREGAAKAALYLVEQEWRAHLEELVVTSQQSGELEQRISAGVVVSSLCGICYNFHVERRFLQVPNSYLRAQGALESLFARASSREARVEGSDC